LPQGRDGTLAWHYYLKDGQLDIHFGEAEEVDFRVIAPYEAVHKLSMEHFGDDPQVAEEKAMVIVAEYAQKGLLEVYGDRSKRPDSLPNVHDALAERTY